MSFNSKELETHCDEIAKDPAIRNRIVVLCEGDSKPFKPTVNALRIKEFAQTIQDSAFYYRAIPDWWRTIGESEPSFYVCGNQKNVIDAYFYLINKDTKVSYLNPDKLFALIDIDLPNKKITGDYPFKDLADIYQNLYRDGKVADTAKQHRIWVTGLLHKEAYFLVPELQELLSNYQPAPIFNGLPIALETLYQKIAGAIATQQDILENFPKAKARISHHPVLADNATAADFQKTWLENFSDTSATDTEKDALIYALLTIAKSKPVWEKIKSPLVSADHKNYRNELCLKIGRDFYAQQPRESEHHLPCFFAAIEASLQ